MKPLRPLVVAGICTFVIGCGQSDTNQVSNVSSNSLDDASKTAANYSQTQVHEVRFKPISLNNSEGAMYVPSETNDESSNLTDFVLNGSSEFGYTDSHSSQNTFQLDSTRETPEYQSVGSFGL